MSFRVLISDYAWPDLEIERQILGPLGVELVAAETGDEAELLKLAPDADVIMACWRPVSAAVMDVSPRCRGIVRYGIGLDNIDVAHATELGMLVTNVPDYCLHEVAEHVMAVVLAWARNLIPLIHETRSGGWNRQVGHPYPRVSGQTLGIVGYGRIAKTLIPKALGTGLKILVHTPRLPAGEPQPGVRATATLAELLAQSDYVTLHVPATPETAGLIGRRELGLMQPHALLINTARGAIVDETALLEALQQQQIGGAALDVLIEEPAPADSPLRMLDNVFLTPHAAFYSDSAIEELQHSAATAVRRMLEGSRPDNIVNPDVLKQPNLRLNR